MTKVKRGFAEASRRRVVEPRPGSRRGAVRALRRLRRLSLPGSRVRRAARAKERAGRGTRSCGSAHRRAAARADRPCRARSTGYRNKLEYSFTAGGGRRWRSASTAPGAGTRSSTSRSACSRRTSGTRSGSRSRDWAREERLEPYDQATGKRLSAPPRRPRGAEHGPGARRARDRAGGAVRVGLPRRRAPAVPRGPLDPLGDQRHAGRADQPPDARCSGATTRSRRRSSACGSASGRPRSCRRTPRWRERLYALAREAAALTGDGERLRPLLRHRHDRARARRERALGLGARDLGGGRRVRDRERRAERDRERPLLRRERRPDARGAARSRPGPRTSSSSIRRGPGWRARRCAGRGALGAPRHRLRVLQPDDARLGRPGAS